MGDFHLSGATLRRQGLNRIGNMIVPNRNYQLFETWIMPILDAMLDEQQRDGVRWTPSKVWLSMLPCKSLLLTLAINCLLCPRYILWAKTTICPAHQSLYMCKPCAVQSMALVPQHRMHALHLQISSTCKPSCSLGADDCQAGQRN